MNPFDVVIGGGPADSAAAVTPDRARPQDEPTRAVVNTDLVAEDVRHAVAAAPFSAEMEREVSERVLGERRHGLTGG
ncbi:hypothetical protein [Nocardiopsis tropica]|uniref:Uncharacterized protein n=1 Tax=Nocardiopsis tropica TaxID=109330 RepID=A0ABU7KYY7_9ACTN|nr:hypothetical protein [Nocardiopsis umidischolae]MEE2053877.1 hypothetical protein [Nocardiopsis umidischolae]